MSASPAPISVVISSPPFPTHRRSRLTLSVHYFLSSVIWSLALIAVLGGWYALEKFVFDLKGTPMRMVADPTEFGVRIVGLAHFIIAAVFLFTSPKLRSPGGWVWLTGLSLAAVFCCWLFAFAGGKDSSIALILFYMFFIIHAFRDEAFFYRIRAGRAAPSEAHTEVVIRWLQVLAICILLGLLVAAISVIAKLGVNDRVTQVFQGMFPAQWPFALAFLTTFLPLAALATYAFYTIQSRQPGGFAGLVATHGPLVRVIGGTMLIMLAGMLVGPWTFNLVILMHFVAWFEFSTVKIRSLPREVRAGASPRHPLNWFKTSLGGFCFFHIGLSVFFLGLIVLNHYVLRRTNITLGDRQWANPLELLFSANNLYYWTIAHVTLSFFPRPAPKPA